MPQIVRHKKTGGLYEVLFRGARVRTDNPLTDYDLVQVVQDKQTSEIFACAPGHTPSSASIILAATVQARGWLRDGDEVVVYRPPNRSLVWVRPTSEMDDGRFEPVGAPTPDPSTPGEVERLVGGINEYAEAIRMHERSLHRTSAEGVEAAAWWWARWQQSAQTIKDILPHITAARPEGAGDGLGDGRRICEALGFDPINHHNALKCPYCNPNGVVLVPAPVSPPDTPSSQESGVGEPALAYEMDGRGAWTWIVWAILNDGARLAAIAATKDRAETYRDVVAQTYPGARFFAERAPVNHAFGAADLRSIAGRAAARASRQGYAAPRPSQREG